MSQINQINLAPARGARLAWEQLWAIVGKDLRM